MIKGDFTNNKWVHFGQMGYEDFTKHKDNIRRNNFINRHYKWNCKGRHSPAWLSYNILW